MIVYDEQAHKLYLSPACLPWIVQQAEVRCGYS